MIYIYVTHYTHVFSKYFWLLTTCVKCEPYSCLPKTCLPTSMSDFDVDLEEMAAGARDGNCSKKLDDPMAGGCGFSGSRKKENNGHLDGKHSLNIARTGYNDGMVGAHSPPLSQEQQRILLSGRLVYWRHSFHSAIKYSTESDKDCK